MNRFVFLFLVSLLPTALFAQSPHHVPHEVIDLPPLAQSPRPYTIESVRNFWIHSMPKLVPPSQMSSNYAYNMPDYRKKLNARNQLIARIRSGEFDERAECALLNHNALLADRLRKHDEAARLRARLKMLHEGSASMSEVAELRMIVQQQCAAIEQLKRDVEVLKVALGHRK